MQKIIIGLVALVVVLVGGWLIYNKTAVPVGEFGTYPYQCDTFSFWMLPNADLTELTVVPGSGAGFSKTVLMPDTNAGGVAFKGGDLRLVGAGESVDLSVQGVGHQCSPVPNPDAAPLNWGDPADAGSIKPDVRVVVGETMQGRWRSTEDAKFTRAFLEQGNVVDRYSGEVVSTGTYAVFTKNLPPIEPPQFPLEDNAVYVQLTMSGSQSEVLNFKVSLNAEGDQLTLIYMDRGGATTYTRVE